jgi:2-dehydro-3-deoxyphosphogluconate aldolase/(4S)-4-hydroxy-2-oxoglutarate aldolase
MIIDDVVRKIGEIGIIPVVRAASSAEACRVVDAICEGGIPIIEVTMTVPGATDVIREITARYKTEVLVGAGTVTTPEQAEACLDAGAEFLVSPGLSVRVMRVAERCEKLMIPGALSPSELMAAHEAGAKLIKIFPCGSMGGPKYIQALRGPFPHIAFIPTGGVTFSNAEEYLAAGAFALGVGTDLVDVKSLRTENSQKVLNAARALVAIVRHARESTEVRG